MSSAVSSLSSTGMSFSRMDEKEKQQALEEEQARLQALKVTDFYFFKSALTQGVRLSAVAAEMPAGLVLQLSPFPPLFSLFQAALSCNKSSTCNRIYEECIFDLGLLLQLVLTCDLSLDTALCE